MTKENVKIYRPSLLSFNKYSTYFNYFMQYIYSADFKSLGTAMKYMFLRQLPEKDYLATSPMGRYLIRKNTNDFQFINMAYESKIKKYLLKNIDSFDVFVDIGACIGEYSIWLAGMGKKCISIEPVNYNALMENKALNKSENVFTWHCGLGSEMRTVVFNIPPGQPSSSALMEGNNNKVTEENQVEVQINTLDYIMKNTPVSFDENTRFLVKLDVEGMETEVIQGGMNFIKTARNITFIYEHFPEDQYKNDAALSAIAQFNFGDIDPVNRVAVKLS